ncbi:cathepsin W-like [Talpa occidentalis]|uniref:cathepsin W-like n=1 Tax=Talpa occidentalis TaxID=50954 RepID=UPI001890794E|nr:cathepsin W-like [Talpa occidentalis]
MSPTLPFSCLLPLWVAGLAQGTQGPLGSQDPGPRPLVLKEAFRLFQIQHNRTYWAPAEYARRLDIFARNLARAQRLQEDMGTAEFGVTPFSDLTEEEFGQFHQRAAGGAPNMSRKAWSQESGRPAPPSCDWRKHRDFSVRDQGTCRCGWAMAAAGNIEALWAIEYRESVEVSVQQLLDCDRCRDRDGCSAGWVWDAFETSLNTSGLVSEQDYPFKGNVEPKTCQAHRNSKKVAWIQDFIMLSHDEQEIAKYLATYGPITVTINKKLLQLYKQGVLKATPANCDPQHVDHSVLLVGFGMEVAASSSRRPARATPYWILKNSWGTKWGEKGYFRLQRGTNACGITKYPFTARVSKPAKKKTVSCPR